MNFPRVFDLNQALSVESFINVSNKRNLILSYSKTLFFSKKPFPTDNCAIITAHNPNASITFTSINNYLNISFVTYLHKYGFQYVTCEGASPCLRHTERSYAIVLNVKQSQQLALRFAQYAFYWITQGKCYLMFTQGDCPPIYLGPLAPRWYRL